MVMFVGTVIVRSGRQLGLRGIYHGALQITLLR